MAYVEKYYHEFCDRYGDTHRISILQDGYVGAATEVEGQPDPIIISYESASEFKFDPIRPSFAEVALTFGTGNGVDFEELWTADEREFKVEYYVEAVLNWVGYIVPDGFQYELKGGVYYAEIKASDGLNTLESIPFSLAGIPYGTQDLTYNNGFEFPFILIATEILRKLELDLNLWTCVDVYEQSMTKTGDTRDADPLANAYVNVKTYINDTKRNDIPYWKDAGEVFDCKEVLENLCYIFGAKVYQNKGVWRIKRVNVDADYGTGVTQRYWRKYNTLAVYLGRETVNNPITINCATIANAMIGTDHLMSMDEVYGAFRMNYEYTFVREGDSPINLFKNGTFADWTFNSQLSAPDSWVRWREGSKWYPKMQPVSIPSGEQADVGGISTAMMMGRQPTGYDSATLDPNAAIWASLKYNETVSIVKGDKLTFEVWNKYKLASDTFGSGVSIVVYYPLYRMRLIGEGKLYYLRNNPAKSGDTTPDKFDWTETPCYFYFTGTKAVNYVDGQDISDYLWYHFKIEIEDPPVTGNLLFDIHGLGATEGRDSDSFPAFPVFQLVSNQLKLTKFIKTVRQDWLDWGGDIPRLLTTGVFLGLIPNEGELPEGQDYVYENPANYSLQVDPITILNGDTQDVKHISNIIVPSNVSGGKNYWDTIDDKYGKSSLGLITVKSIMNLYIKPFRILEGTIMAQGMDFDKLITFEAVPGINFIIQKASFNPMRAYVQDATFVEISDVAIDPGGLEGGNTLDPIWIRTGNIRCEKNAGTGLNTGFREWEEVDENVASESFGQTRWVSSNPIPDIGCPIGEPSPYYWGTDDVSLDPDNLTDFTYTIDSDKPREVQVPYSNPGGEYVYFLHLDTLGVVESVFTASQDEIISDFQYLADVLIDGYTYRVFRMNYVTADFENLVITYVFSQDQIEPEGEPPPGLVTYYRLNSCGTLAQAYTTLAPGGANQLYIYPFGLNYYIWDGTDTELSSPPFGFNGSIQIITGQFGCP